MKNLSNTLLLFTAVTIVAMGQPVKIRFSNGISTSTKMTASSEVQMFTEQGVFAYSQIQSVAFWEAFPDSVSIHNMRTHGIAVYLKKQRLGPITKQVSKPEYHSSASVGLGLGLDYGGIGIRMTVFPAGPISIFVGGGSNIAEIGYNVGTEIKFSPHKRSSAYISGMYGYNGVVGNKTFYGFSAGIGVKVRAAKSDKNYFSVQAIFPFREPGFKQAAGDAFAPPVLVSLGFHFGF